MGVKKSLAIARLLNDVLPEDAADGCRRDRRTTTNSPTTERPRRSGQLTSPLTASSMRSALHLSYVPNTQNIHGHTQSRQL